MIYCDNIYELRDKKSFKKIMKKNLYIIMEIATKELDANLILILFSLKKEFNVFIEIHLHIVSIK